MIEAVMQRLEEKALVLTSVAPAEDMEALSKGTAPKDGATFVIHFQDRPEPNVIMSGGFSQRIEVLIIVAFVIRRHGDAKGSIRATSFDTYKDAIETALAGWSPSDENDLFELAAGRAAPLGNGVTIYAQTWKTSRYLTGRNGES